MILGSLEVILQKRSIQHVLLHPFSTRRNDLQQRSSPDVTSPGVRVSGCIITLFQWVACLHNSAFVNIYKFMVKIIINYDYNDWFPDSVVFINLLYFLEILKHEIEPCLVIKIMQH
jgi:hypothetical protein